MLRKMILIFLAIGLLSTSLFAFPRKVFYELAWEATDWESSTWYTMFNDFLNNPDYSDNVAGLVYHCGEGDDPWFDLTHNHSYRLSYYEIFDFLPSMRVDGVLVYSAWSMATAYDIRSVIDSPIMIEMQANLVGEHIAVTIDVTTGNRGVPGNHKLRVALIDLVLMDFWAAPNGQNDYYWDMVELYPNDNGQHCLIPAYTTSSFTATFDWPITLYNQQLELDNTKIVAWVQDDNTREVLNVEWVCPRETNVYLHADEKSTLVAPGTEKEFNLTFSNLLEDEDNFNVLVETTLPSGWTFGYTTPEGGETGYSVIDMDGNAEFTSVVTISTDDTPGAEGTVTFHVNSDAYPDETISVSFYVNVAGDVMIVDESGVPENMSYYSDAIANVTAFEGFSVGVWDNDAYTLNQFELMDVEPQAIFWVGGTEGGIATEYIETMEDYLENGGKLWITGNAIANDLQGTDLLNDMGATYEGHNDVGNHISGVTDEPYFGAIDADLFGGDGADNNSNPAVFTPCGGTECLKLSQQNITGIYHQTDSCKTVLFGFPFESIATAEARNAVMSGVAGVLLSESNVPGDQGSSDLPSRFALEQNYPNPFNPTTTISFSLPMTAKVTLQVFNLEGQEVKSLAEGEYSAGHHTVTFNGSDLASGVYIYRMTATGEESYNTSRKMLLIK